MTWGHACRAYIARQLLPTDMRNWKAAGILAYTVDARGLYVLLGKLEPGAAVQQGSSRYREGWWILGEPLLPKPGRSLCCCHPGCARAGKSPLPGAPVLLKRTCIEMCLLAMLNEPSRL